MVPALFLPALLLGVSGVASAQVSGSVALVSDYIYRGVSLSHDNPEAQLNLSADFDSGWFAGLFASPVDLPTTHGQFIAYGGYAHQWTSDLSWEAGFSESGYVNGSSQDYAEAFVGLSTDRFNGRLYYSPDYLGQSLHSEYAELNFNQPLSDRWRFTAHAGYLRVTRHADEGSNASHGDTRVGLAYHVGDWNLQWGIASVRETTAVSYYYTRATQHYTGVVNAAWNF